MNVPNIAQGPGVVTIPDAQTGGGTAPVARAVAGSATDVSFTRLAWFDTNGDGNIDPRPAADGGDATLLVPSHAVALPTYSRHVQTVGDIRAFKLRPLSDKSASAPNTAQTRQAIDAYQRYGQAAPAPTPAPAPAPVVEAVSAPTPPVTPVPTPAPDTSSPSPAPASGSGAPTAAGSTGERAA